MAHSTVPSNVWFRNITAIDCGVGGLEDKNPVPQAEIVALSAKPLKTCWIFLKGVQQELLKHLSITVVLVVMLGVG